VLFTGALWRRENEGGVLWFIERVWPHVRAALPAATLALVGAGASFELAGVANATEGVELVGEVPDLMPYYQRASLFVAPLFVRGGLKFKVPQAMLCGLPVVATTVAVEGVIEAAPPGSLWVVSDDPLEMAAGVVTGLRDSSGAAEVGVRAAAWSRDFYSFERSMDRLMHLYANVIAQPDRQR
jgi:glycosyltransferase involved in cell wall biosynthesis